MRAWRNSGSGSSTAGGVGGPGALGGSGNIGQSLSQASTKVGTGWISELNPRKGVLTFENGGHDERVLFLASKVITLSSPFLCPQNSLWWKLWKDLMDVPYIIGLFLRKKNWCQAATY